jgi:hypothetical protein
MARNDLRSSIERSNSLTDLAARIKAEHDASTLAIKRGVEHAIRCGRLLIDAKEQIKHGQWLPWLRDHCGVNERTAQQYMRLARHAEELESKSASLADLTVEEAVALIAPIAPVETSSATYQFLTQLQLIDPRIVVTQTGMKLPPDLPFEKWQAVGQLLLSCFPHALDDEESRPQRRRRA